MLLISKNSVDNKLIREAFVPKAVPLHFKRGLKNYKLELLIKKNYLLTQGICNVLTVGTFIPLGPLICPSSEGEISSFEPMAQVKMGPFSCFLVKKTMQLVLLIQNKISESN